MSTRFRRPLQKNIGYLIHRFRQAESAAQSLAPAHHPYTTVSQGLKRRLMRPGPASFSQGGSKRRLPLRSSFCLPTLPSAGLFPAVPEDGAHIVHESGVDDGAEYAGSAGKAWGTSISGCGLLSRLVRGGTSRRSCRRRRCTVSAGHPSGRATWSGGRGLLGSRLYCCRGPPRRQMQEVIAVEVVVISRGNHFSSYWGLPLSGIGLSVLTN